MVEIVINAPVVLISPVMLKALFELVRAYLQSKAEKQK